MCKCADIHENKKTTDKNGKKEAIFKKYAHAFVSVELILLTVGIILVAYSESLIWLGAILLLIAASGVVLSALLLKRQNKRREVESK